MTDRTPTSQEPMTAEGALVRALADIEQALVPRVQAAAILAALTDLGYSVVPRGAGLDAIGRLEAWAGCVRRLIATAPIKAVKYETGVRGGSSTPPEREAIRKAALAVVDGWLARDRAALRSSDDSTPDGAR